MRSRHGLGRVIAASVVGTYVFALFIITYATDHVGLSQSAALNAVLIGSALQLFIIPACGALSDRVGRRPVYAAGALGAFAWAGLAS